MHVCIFVYFTDVIYYIMFLKYKIIIWLIKSVCKEGVHKSEPYVMLFVKYNHFYCFFDKLEIAFLFF